MIILLCLGVGIIGFVAGWKYREYTAQRILKAVFKDVVENIASNVVEVWIERHNDVFYVYNKETGEFLAQGSSSAEVTEALQKAHPTKSFTTNRDRAIELGYIDDL